MKTQIKLIETFCSNFVAYFRSHSCHLNITGRNFYSDHKLLQKIYEDAQEQIDVIGELIRACGERAPETLNQILDFSTLSDTTTMNDSDSLLSLVLDAQEHMIAEFEELEEYAEEEEYDDIENYAADRIKQHRKFAWMLKATLGEEDEQRNY